MKNMSTTMEWARATLFFSLHFFVDASTELAFYVNWKTSDQRKYEEAEKKLRAKKKMETEIKWAEERRARESEREREAFGEKRRANNIRVQDASTWRK